VKFFSVSDEETYSLQIDNHFEVLTKKTQMFSRHQYHRFGRQDWRQGQCFYWSGFAKSVKITILN